MVSFFPQPCPQLPNFQSLLVRGSYHPSAPIHLLLSHGFENPEDKAVLLTPHRESFRNALIELNDRWFELHGGNGRSSGSAQRTQILFVLTVNLCFGALFEIYVVGDSYPPTLAHLRLTLSMLHEYEDTLHHRKVTLEAAPTLLVLHEPSAYFAAETTQATCVHFNGFIFRSLKDIAESRRTSLWYPPHWHSRRHGRPRGEVQASCDEFLRLKTAPPTTQFNCV